MSKSTLNLTTEEINKLFFYILTLFRLMQKLLTKRLRLRYHPQNFFEKCTFYLENYIARFVGEKLICPYDNSKL